MAGPGGWDTVALVKLTGVLLAGCAAVLGVAACGAAGAQAAPVTGPQFELWATAQQARAVAALAGNPVLFSLSGPGPLITGYADAASGQVEAHTTSAGVGVDFRCVATDRCWARTAPGVKWQRLAPGAVQVQGAPSIGAQLAEVSTGASSVTFDIDPDTGHVHGVVGNRAQPSASSVFSGRFALTGRSWVSSVSLRHGQSAAGNVHIEMSERVTVPRQVTAPGVGELAQVAGDPQPHLVLDLVSASLPVPVRG